MTNLALLNYGLWLLQTLALCRNVKNRLDRECRLRNIAHHLISCRLTQTYDAGPSYS